MVVAFKDKDRVTIGLSDWVLEATNQREYLMNIENLPLMMCEDSHVLVVAPVTCRSTDVLLTDEAFFHMMNGHKITHNYLVKTVVPYVKDKLSNEGVLEHDLWMEGIIIADDKNIWKIDRDFYVEDAENFAVLDLRDEFITGILLQNKHLSGKDRIVDTFEGYASYYNDMTYPVATIDTKASAPDLII